MIKSCFIVLTLLHNGISITDVTVNTSAIQYIFGVSDSTFSVTHVEMLGGKSLQVKEKPEEIRQLIDNYCN